MNWLEEENVFTHSTINITLWWRPAPALHCLVALSLVGLTLNDLIVCYLNSEIYENDDRLRKEMNLKAKQLLSVFCRLLLHGWLAADVSQRKE